MLKLDKSQEKKEREYRKYPMTFKPCDGEKVRGCSPLSFYRLIGDSYLGTPTIASEGFLLHSRFQQSPGCDSVICAPH